MKAVLLKALRVNGVSVAHATEGPTIIDVADDEFDSLATRGVVRPVSKADLALAGLSDPAATEAADAAEKAAADAAEKAAADAAEKAAAEAAEKAAAEAAEKAAKAAASKKPGKAETPAADDDL